MLITECHLPGRLAAMGFSVKQRFSFSSPDNSINNLPEICFLLLDSAFFPSFACSGLMVPCGGGGEFLLLLLFYKLVVFSIFFVNLYLCM